MPGPASPGMGSSSHATAVDRGEMVRRQQAIDAIVAKNRAERDAKLARGEQLSGMAGAVQKLVAQQQSSSLNPASSAAGAQEIYRQALANAQRGYSAGDMSQGVGLARDAAMGTAPSAAQAQYQMALQQAANQRQSAIAGARGAERGALRLQGIQQEGDANAMAAQGSAALRANEMAVGRGQYMDALSAQESAQRGAFDSTAGAQQGFLGTGVSAVGTQGNIANDYATNLRLREQGNAEIAQRERERRTNRNMALLNAGTTLAAKLIPTPKAG